ncbi:hypothetical protein [Streptomyces microflavus]|nr:hypothetical protein [Streptomyces microflavus]
MDELTHWVIEGRDATPTPSFQGHEESPDGENGTRLRHHWVTRVDGLWLVVIGPSVDDAHHEYRRLWAEQRAG